MSRATQEDRVMIRMGLDVLLECVRQSESWWRVCGDGVALRCAQQLGRAIFATRRKFFAEDSGSYLQVTEALIVAEGLREAARHCKEGQGALHARLTAGAQVIERLCRWRSDGHDAL